MVLLLLLAGCFVDPPVVDAITPSVLMPGDEVTLTGSAFGTDLVVTLEDGARSVVLPVNVEAEVRAVGVVADDVPPGHYVVHVRRDDHPAVHTPALEVWTADAEPPCRKRYSLSTETSRTQRKVAFLRTFTDRPPTRQVYFGDDLVSLEHTATPLPDGATCSAIWLHTADGGRWLLADDDAVDLSERAAALAGVLGIPLG
ncbi:MAG: hypothetical protein H6733_09655 [Alphaproteobacteria bacterium]|nr:hypothetical protein [Alphaproteobacteria bacterium]